MWGYLMEVFILLALHVCHQVFSVINISEDNQNMFLYRSWQAVDGTRRRSTAFHPMLWPLRGDSTR